MSAIPITQGQPPVGPIMLSAPLGWPDDLRGLRAGLDERLAQVKQVRQGYEPHWRSLAKIYRPRWNNWLDETMAQRGAAKDNEISHSGPMLATRILRGGMFIGLTPPTREYHQLVPRNRELKKHWRVQTWLRDVDRVLREQRARTNAYATYAAVFGDEAVWGCGALAYFSDPHDVYVTVHYPVGSFWLGVDSYGRPNELWLGQRVTASQLADRFGKDRLPWRVRQDLEQQSLHTEWKLFCVIHATPPQDRGPWSPGLPWRAVWFLEEVEADAQDRHGILDIQGFYEQPWMAPRWATSGTDPYAVESPAMIGRGDAASLQHMMDKLALAIDRIVDPPLVADTQYETGGRRLSLKSGDVTYGGFANGKPPVASVYDQSAGQRVVELFQLMQDMEDRVRQACYADVFYMFALSRDDQGKTATEASYIQEEKRMQLGIVLERHREDFLEKKLAREFGLLLRNGLLPPPPDELINAGGFMPQFLTLVEQAQRALATQKVREHVAFAAEMSQFKPEALDLINVDEIVREHADAMGVQATATNPEDVVQEIRRRRAEQQAMEQQMAQAAAAQPAARAARDLSETQPERVRGVMQQLFGPVAG